MDTVLGRRERILREEDIVRGIQDELSNHKDTISPLAFPDSLAGHGARSQQLPLPLDPRQAPHSSEAAPDA